MRIEVHPTHPQARSISLACDKLCDDGVIVYPTDSCYALGCALESHGAVQRIRLIRQMGKQHHLTLICRDLSELSTFARVDNACYRLIKSLTPGPYTFILQATRELPRRLHDPKRKAIGLRIPRHNVTSTLLQALGTPMLSTTAYDELGKTPLVDPDEIEQRLGRRVDLILDAGIGGAEPTTVIDLSCGDPVLVRKGLGSIDHLLDLERS